MINKKKCNICVMDTSASDIYFDNNGQCNYCKNFKQKINFSTKLYSDDLLKKIKFTTKNKKYDCIVGLSGGIDSSYTLVKVVEMGLTPLAVHLDNGWNSELAQNNIENLVKKLNVDLYTHVVDWNEYKNMMNSFFMADVIDIEMLMDNAMLSINYSIAKKENIKYILSGTNTSTEGMDMPKNMNWIKYDKKNIKAILKKFGNNRIINYPVIGIFDLIKYIILHKIKWVNFLDYYDYNKEDATNYLVRKFDFKPYKYKHYESIFTRFYQGYLLPKKFNIDKRILHLSTLIVTNQLSRKEAIIELEKDPYPSVHLLEEDMDYFLKKMNWTKEKLEDYLDREPKSHRKYPNNYLIFNFLLKVFKLIYLKL